MSQESPTVVVSGAQRKEHVKLNSKKRSPHSHLVMGVVASLLTGALGGFGACAIALWSPFWPTSKEESSHQVGTRNDELAHQADTPRSNNEHPTDQPTTPDIESELQRLQAAYAERQKKFEETLAQQLQTSALVTSEEDGFALWSKGRLSVTDASGENLIFEIDPSQGASGLWSNLGVQGDLTVTGQGSLASLQISDTITTQLIKASEITASTQINAAAVVAQSITTDALTVPELKTGDINATNLATTAIETQSLNAAAANIQQLTTTLTSISLHPSSAGVALLRAPDQQQIEADQTKIPLTVPSGTTMVFISPIYSPGSELVHIAVEQNTSGEFFLVGTWPGREAPMISSSETSATPEIPSQPERGDVSVFWLAVSTP